MAQRQRREGRKPKLRVARATRSQALIARGQLWLLRGLLAGRGWRRLISEIPDDLDDGEMEGINIGLLRVSAVCGFLGMEPEALKDLEPKKARRRLKARYQQLLAQPAPGFPNRECLTHEIGLTALEADLVIFAALAGREKGFQEGLKLLGAICSAEALFSAVASCLAAPAEEIGFAFGRQGALAASGLVSLDRDAGPYHDFHEWLKLLPGLAQRLDEPGLTAATLLSRYLKVPTDAPRPLSDFAYLAAVNGVLKPLLRGALAAHAKGVNILLHGATGAGKTCLVHALANDLAARLLEVAVADEDGDALKREGRVQALRLVGRLGMQQGGRALVLFDEVEDYFAHRRRGRWWNEIHGDDAPGKGYTVELLESAPAPTFWLTNDIEGIDPAYRRRFDFVLELTPPPLPVRERIAAQYLASVSVEDPGLRHRMAAHEGLAPGLIARAAQTAKLAESMNLVERARVLEATLNSHLEALGHTPLPKPPRASVPYGLEYLTLATDPAALIAGLRAKPEARFLFYGPSGTGKSALAQHMAETLGIPYLKQRASDLLSPYVGESEQAIRAMFRRARAQGALLVLDECDSFLTSRGYAQRSWEVSLVNEMLTQMEDYAGIFVATTNFLDALDEASLRRFDIKLEFTSLEPDKAAALFAAVLEREGCVLSGSERGPWRERLKHLDGLTPGDFKAALRGLSLKGSSVTPETLLVALDCECAMKFRGRHRRPIGFTAPAVL